MGILARARGASGAVTGTAAAIVVTLAGLYLLRPADPELGSRGEPLAAGVPLAAARSGPAIANPAGTDGAAPARDGTGPAGVAGAPTVTGAEAGGAAGPDRASKADPGAALRFDLVRSERDGTVLVAGRAPAGSEVAIRVDGAVVEVTRADSAGHFAAFLNLGTADAARLLDLAVSGAAGEVTSETSVLLAAAAPRGGESAEESAGDVDPRTPSPHPLIASGPAPAATDPSAGAEELTTRNAALPAPRFAPVGAPAPEGDAEVRPERPPVLLAGPDGVEVLQGAEAGEASDGADRVDIDAISYGARGGVSVAGRADAGGHVRLYLDNRALTEAPVNEDGRWGTELGDVDPGTYTLRADRLDGSGRVTARAESPFRRESAAALEAARPAPGAGGDGATAITVQPSHTLWAIARERYGDGLLYVRVFDANRTAIRNPDLIYPGQIFAMPVE
ncbi:LysM peptidoglycan-binding domain-containing protein [Roseivivax sp. CAU 1761]